MPAKASQKASNQASGKADSGKASEKACDVLQIGNNLPQSVSLPGLLSLCGGNVLIVRTNLMMRTLIMSSYKPKEMGLIWALR